MRAPPLRVVLGHAPQHFERTHLRLGVVPVDGEQGNSRDLLDEPILGIGRQFDAARVGGRVPVAPALGIPEADAPDRIHSIEARAVTQRSAG